MNDKLTRRNAEYRHKYYLAHKDKFREYYLTHKNKILEYQRRYRQRYRDQIREYNRNYARKVYVRVTDPRFVRIFNKIWNEVKNGKQCR